MTVYSGCRRCGQVLVVTDLAQQTCAGCAPIPDPFDATIDRLSEAINRFMKNESEGLDIDWLAAQCERMEHAPPRLGDAALAYAAWGWPVFPLLTRGKRPATRNGFMDATTDFAQVRRWWGQAPALHEYEPHNPQYNVGLATGVCFDVIDVDPAKGGAESWSQLRVHPTLPDIHGRVITRSDGFHCYVEITGGGNRANIYPGIDYRGRGGYVVAPPSQVPIVEEDPSSELKSYRWSIYPSPRIVPSRGGVVPQ